MLVKSNAVLLLSDVAKFATSYKALAKKAGVRLNVESVWNKSYRIKEDTVIFGSKYLKDINRAYYPKAVLILKPEENPEPYMAEGITRFIFDFKNSTELRTALYYPEKTVLLKGTKQLQEIIKEANTSLFSQGDYCFEFDRNVFKYKGRSIYLCSSQKEYLASWLLNGNKDNDRRIILFNLRKKFGKDFLNDIDRFGQIKKEEKNEQ